MKKIILIIFFAGNCMISKAQKEPLVTPYAVPVDTITNLITYESVVDVKDVKDVELYSRINNWFHEFYKNPKEVIRENDSVNFKIVGKPRFRIANSVDKDGIKMEGGLIQYTITVSARDGRFKYELTAFNWKQESYFASERWLDTKAKSYKPIYNDYLQQMDTYSLDLIKSLKEAVSHEKPKKEKDKW